MPNGSFSPFSAKVSVQFGFAVAIGVAQHLDRVGAAFGDEDVAVGRGQEVTRVAKAGGVLLDLESGGNLRLRAIRPIHDPRARW